MSRVCRLLSVGFALLVLLAPVQLPLLPEARGLLESLGRDCPECLERGVIPCGTADIGPGKGFARNLLQGEPERGYLVATDYVDRFHGWYRDPSLSAQDVEARVRSEFEASRLIAIESEFSRLRVIGAPQHIEARIEEPHRGCLADPKAFECSGGECCNKRYGATEVRVTWQDSQMGESLIWSHSPAAAQTVLRRGAVAYWCLAWESGRLVGAQGAH